MTNDTIKIIVDAVIAIIVALIYAKAQKDKKFAKVLQFANVVKDIVINYYKDSPDLQITVDKLLATFKTEILKLIPLSDDEISFLFNYIVGDITKALNIKTSATNNYMIKQSIVTENKVKTKLLFK